MSQRIIIGEYYRHSNTPNYGWAKALEILKPHRGVNTHGYSIVRCEWSVSKDDLFGMIKYFKVEDLVKENP